MNLVCDICRISFYHGQFGHHVHKVHKLTSEDYFVNVLGNKIGVCRYVNCNNITNFVSFSHGYRKYCSKGCSIKQEQLNDPTKRSRAGMECQRKHKTLSSNNGKIVMQNRIKKYGMKKFKEMQSDIGKIGGKIGGVNCHKIHPNLAKQNGVNSCKSGILMSVQRSNWFSCKKNMPIMFRGEAEKAFYKVLDLCESVVDYTYEPFVIDYVYDNKNRYYIPDLLISYDTGIKHLIELKTRHRSRDVVLNESKFEAARSFCVKYNINKFEVLTMDNGDFMKYMFKHNVKFGAIFISKLMKMFNVENFGEFLK